MPNRTDLLNHLASKYNLQRYLEVGVQNTAQNFDKIICEEKICVDPDPDANATFCQTSDEYFDAEFSSNNIFPEEYHKKFDLVFIDGLHTAEQVKKDFENALKVLSPNGFIVLHDCNPLKEEHTIVPRPTERGHWNGDVYKFACQLSTNWLSFKTVDIDNGCGIYCKNTLEVNFDVVPTWGHFDKNRKTRLNLISWEQFIKCYE
jgi:hypothetical protein